MKCACVFLALLCLAGCEKKKPADPTANAATCEGTARTHDPFRLAIGSDNPNASGQSGGGITFTSCIGQGCSKEPTLDSVFVELRTNTYCPADFKAQLRAPNGAMYTLWDHEGECVFRPPGVTGSDYYVLKPKAEIEGQRGQNAVGSFVVVWSRGDAVHHSKASYFVPTIEVWLTVTSRRYVC